MFYRFSIRLLVIQDQVTGRVEQVRSSFFIANVDDSTRTSVKAKLSLLVKSYPRQALRSR